MTAHADWIRPGIMLYGASPFEGKTGIDHGLRPVMTVKTNLIAVAGIKTGRTGGLWCKVGVAA